ncbi:MAG: hypothetical protein ACI8P3_000016 [Saprospiraceae bacterium]|jgi:hypothetical protein
MKNVFQILGMVAIFLALLAPQNSYGQVKVGASHKGGIVVFVDGTGQHGLVCSKKDLGIFVWDDAVAKCKAYEGGGYTDWYLPSNFEFFLLFTNLYRKGLGGFDNGDYWSSSEFDDYTASVQGFGSGRMNYIAKGINGHVRAVRAF